MKLDKEKRSRGNNSLLLEMKRALVNEPGLMDGSIGIEIQQNKTIIAGTVQSKNYMDKVLRVLKRAGSVNSFENYLVIAKTQAQQDHSLSEHIKSVLKSYFTDSSLQVSVVFDRAIVFGRVNSPMKLKLIENTVKKHFGRISKVENRALAA